MFEVIQMQMQVVLYYSNASANVINDSNATASVFFHYLYAIASVLDDANASVL